MKSFLFDRRRFPRKKRRNQSFSVSWKLAMGLWAASPAWAVWAQAGGSTEYPEGPAQPGGTYGGQPVATELSPELKRLIDSVKRLHIEPGLILDREGIYAALDMRPENLRTFKDNEGGRNMGERLVPRRSPGDAIWGTSLYYWDDLKTNTWGVQVVVGGGGAKRDPVCYPSRLLEAHWGQPFVYQRAGVHTPYEAGPHDGWPNSPGFTSPFPNSATVIFILGWGSCLATIQASKTFNLKEYSNGHIYHE
ncbi:MULTISPECIES: hypothetical protein [unclassified Variovorax]|uniref:hypothetical protein n=1 Tax=unclassified Variovorax TaxID=663243 RepID=UPI003F48F73E